MCLFVFAATHFCNLNIVNYKIEVGSFEELCPVKTFNSLLLIQGFWLFLSIFCLNFISFPCPTSTLQNSDSRLINSKVMRSDHFPNLESPQSKSWYNLQSSSSSTNRFFLKSMAVIRSSTSLSVNLLPVFSSSSLVKSSLSRKPLSQESYLLNIFFTNSFRYCNLASDETPSKLTLRFKCGLAGSSPPAGFFSIFYLTNLIYFIIENSVLKRLKVYNVIQINCKYVCKGHRSRIFQQSFLHPSSYSQTNLSIFLHPISSGLSSDSTQLISRIHQVSDSPCDLSRIHSLFSWQGWKVLHQFLIRLCIDQLSEDQSLDLRSQDSTPLTSSLLVYFLTLTLKQRLSYIAMRLSCGLCSLSLLSTTYQQERALSDFYNCSHLSFPGGSMAGNNPFLFSQIFINIEDLIHNKFTACVALFDKHYHKKTNIFTILKQRPTQKNLSYRQMCCLSKIIYLMLNLKIGSRKGLSTRENIFFSAKIGIFEQILLWQSIRFFLNIVRPFWLEDMGQAQFVQRVIKIPFKLHLFQTVFTGICFLLFRSHLFPDICNYLVQLVVAQIRVFNFHTLFFLFQEKEVRSWLSFLHFVIRTIWTIFF